MGDTVFDRTPHWVSQLRDYQARTAPDPWTTAEGSPWRTPEPGPWAKAAAAALQSKPAQMVMDWANFAGPPVKPGIRAFHGSPHSFEKFDVSRIGTGEGHQAYGRGLYFAESEGVARSYRDKLSAGIRPEYLKEYFKPGEVVPSYGGLDRVLAYDPDTHAVTVQAVDAAGNAKGRPRTHRTLPDEREIKAVLEQRGVPYQPPGHMYEVNINARPDQLLDWDKPLSAQSDVARDVLRQNGVTGDPSHTGTAINAAHDWSAAVNGWGRDGARKILAEDLSAAGIPGIRYKDQMSRGAEGGTSNYVIFDDKNIDIIRKYLLAGLLAGGATAATQPDAQAGQ